MKWYMKIRRKMKRQRAAGEPTCCLRDRAVRAREDATRAPGVVAFTYAALCREHVHTCIHAYIHVYIQRLSARKRGGGAIQVTGKDNFAFGVLCFVFWAGIKARFATI